MVTAGPGSGRRPATGDEQSGHRAERRLSAESDSGTTRNAAAHTRRVTGTPRPTRDVREDERAQDELSRVCAATLNAVRGQPVLSPPGEALERGDSRRTPGQRGVKAHALSGHTRRRPAQTRSPWDGRPTAAPGQALRTRASTLHVSPAPRGCRKTRQPPRTRDGTDPRALSAHGFSDTPLSRGRKSNSPIPAGSQQRGAHEACRLLFPLTNGRSACFQGEPRHLFQGGGPLTRPRNAILMTQLPLKDVGVRATVAERFTPRRYKSTTFSENKV